MLFKKDELKLLWPFYVYCLLIGLTSMIMPFMIIYFLNLGFSYFQMALITSAMGFTTLIFEIPTGAFADGYSRKKSTILGFFIMAIGVLIIPFTNNFYILIVAWGIAGIGLTFITGAEEAWVIDNLNNYGRKDLHQEFFIKSGSIAAFGAVFAPFIGAILTKQYSITFLWYVLSFGFFLSALILWIFTKEYYKPTKKSIVTLIKETYNNMKKGMKICCHTQSITTNTFCRIFHSTNDYRKYRLATFTS